MITTCPAWETSCGTICTLSVLFRKKRFNSLEIDRDSMKLLITNCIGANRTRIETKKPLKAFAPS